MQPKHEYSPFFLRKTEKNWLKAFVCFFTIKSSFLQLKYNLFIRYNP